MLQGERQLARDNKTIGKFHLTDIPPAPRGVPQIEVTFDIDANGILHVSAKDLGTGKEQKITITASSGLSKDEIEKMRKDAEAHAEDDKKRREEIETRNEADNAVYRSEKMLKDNADKISGADKSKIEDAIKEVKEAVKGGDAAAIRVGQREAQRGLAGGLGRTLQGGRRKGARRARPQGQPGGRKPGGRSRRPKSKKGKRRRPDHRRRSGGRQEVAFSRSAVRRDFDSTHNHKLKEQDNKLWH